MFPVNASQDTHLIRHRGAFEVKKCYAESYKKSVIPTLHVGYIQGILNYHMDKLEALRRKRAGPGGQSTRRARGSRARG